MPAITYDQFDGGLDRRLPINVQQANKLWVLRNAYVTMGKRIKKRHGLVKVATGLAGSYGLESVSGRLKVFVDTGATFTPPSLVDKVELDKPTSASTSALKAVHWAEVFNGYTYAVAEYENGALAHHYVDGATTYISDSNCPNTISVTKAAERIFAINGETVRYSAAGNPRDWTTPSDAGFLPVGLRQGTKQGCTAVGTFQDKLVVFFSESSQIWSVAVDPASNDFVKRVPGIGISDAPLSMDEFAQDLCFLSPYGVRSMTVAQNVDRIDDTDLGVPIDTLVVPAIAVSASQPDRVQTFGVWINELGQYWLVLDAGATSRVFTYNFSRSSKIAAWSEYTFPYRFRGIATLGGKVYLRTEDELFEVDADTYIDDVHLIGVEVQMAYQDAKTPGVEKQFMGTDAVFEGSPTVSFKFDPRDQNKETIPQTITGDTRPGEVIPVEMMAPAVAPVFRHSADEPFELSAISIYYQLLGLNR